MEKNAPKKKKRLTPLDIILYCISAALLIGGVALIIRQYVLISDYVDPPQPSITPTAVPNAHCSAESERDARAHRGAHAHAVSIYAQRAQEDIFH